MAALIHGLVHGGMVCSDGCTSSAQWQGVRSVQRVRSVQGVRSVHGCAVRSAQWQRVSAFMWLDTMKEVMRTLRFD